ncbi:hypothetical protein D1872_309940 [compost metagenome]
MKCLTTSALHSLAPKSGSCITLSLWYQLLNWSASLRRNVARSSGARSSAALAAVRGSLLEFTRILLLAGSPQASGSTACQSMGPCLARIPAALA